MNLARATVSRLDDSTRLAWVESGILSPVSRIRPFSPIADYAGVEIPPAPAWSLSLSSPLKTDGSINLHHGAYPALSSLYLKDAMAVIDRRPGDYLRTVAVSLRRFFSPSEAYGPLSRIRPAVAPWERLYEGVFRWTCPLLWLVGLWVCLRRRRDPIFAAVGITIVYVTLISVTMEWAETARFRMLLDPLLVALGAYLPSMMLASSARAASQSSGLIDQEISLRTQVGSVGSEMPFSQRALGTIREMIAWERTGSR
jgi:hypothetical protein